MIKSNLHIITSLESGGAQKVLYDYLVETSSYNSNKQIVISLRGEGFYSKKINALGIDLIYLSTMRGVLSFVKLLIFSKGYIKCWMYHACLLSMFFCFLPYRRIYWSIHHGRIDLNSDSNSTIISAKICSIVSRFVPQKVIYVSKFCLQEHLKFGFSKSNAIVIYNWVPAYRSDLPKLEDRHYDFCFVGRDHPNKNLRMFLDSSIETVNNGNIRRFLIAGHGTERNMDYVLSHLNIKDNINLFSFLGEVENIESVYLNSKVYINTSRVESFGLTSLEAIKYGCLVFCPNESIFKEILEESAHYFTLENSFELNSLIRDFSVEKISSVSAEILGKFSKKNTLIKMYELIND